ncbi:hypothetical protein R1flu_013587 [Riccia fluitans]|uniref:NB-ARC domain-containing protein n=1 Tax=Riccia fluitans TaxID=41844 RepID=A0ABD1YDN9_9MARC
MDRITRQPSESVSEIKPESSGTADSEAHALGDKFHRKINDSVYELYRPPTADMNTDIDIVFFHGLQLKQDATPYLSTWRARDAERSLWPSKWLAEDYPSARILSVLYDGSMKKTDRDGRMDLHLVAESLLHSLLLARVGQSCPVILVGHSFGGLVIKKLCVISADQARRGKRPAGFTFFNNITGICFYATPHQGSRLGDVEKFDSQEGELVSVVRVHSRELARLNEDFECLRDGPWDIDITSMGEILPSDMDKGRYVIVEEASARYLGTFTVLQEDHISICQPRERTNTSYKTLVDFILQVQQKRRNVSEDFGGDIQPLPKTQVGLLASWIEGEISKSFEEHQAIGLWGMGGIGKTTLAKAIFNRERSKFYYTLFVRDVKTFPEERPWIEFQKFFLDHTFCKGRKVENNSDISIFRNKDILVVLDDVEKDRDVNIVTVLQDVCSPKSRFVLTSRDRQIMRRVDGLQIIEITSLDDRDSEKLFRSIVVPESEEASEEWQEDCLKDIVKYCGGLPLILKVIGQYLKTTQEKGIWKETLESLRNVGEGIHDVEEVLKKLQVSYDQLGKVEKEMFMDVATIFSNYRSTRKFSARILSPTPWTLAEAKAVWRVVHGNENSRWKILVDRALVYQVTDEDSELKMHEHLQALGRKLARDEGRSDRIDYKSVYHISKMVQEKALYHEKLQHLDVWGKPSRPKRSVLQKLMPCIRSLQFAPSISFHKMQNLRYLQVSGLSGSRLKLPESLVIFDSRRPIESCSFQPNTQLAVLLLRDFRGRYLPDSFSDFKNSLQFLEVTAERLKSLPESFGHLKMLRECALKCPLVRELPCSLGSLESLKKLMLECASLERLPDSICRLRELHMMELRNCRNLEELPTDIGCLQNIQSLIIENDGDLDDDDGRGKLQSLPDSLGNLRNLQRLSVENTDVKELPSSIGDLQCLEHLTVSNEQLQELPASLGRLEKLQVLEVRFSDLKELPASIGDLESLERLTVYSTRLQGLPTRLGDLRGLKSLVVCSEALEDIPTSLSTLQSLGELRLEGKLVRENGETAAEFLSDCCTHLTNLQTLRLISQRLERLPHNLANLKKLQILVLQCPEVSTLPDSWEALPELRSMELSCLSKTLTGRWGGMTALEELKVSDCRELTSFPDSLGELKALRDLRISSCNELRSLPESVGRVEMLKGLSVEHCAKLESLPESLGQLTSLERLCLSDLPLIKRIPSLHTISSLSCFWCGNLPKLKCPPNVPPKCEVFY